MMRPMIRVTTLMPVLPINLNSKGAARNISQEQKEKMATTSDNAYSALIPLL